MNQVRSRRIGGFRVTAGNYEGWRGNPLVDTQTGADTLGQSGFSSAQLTFQNHQIAGLQKWDQGLAQQTGIVSRSRFDFQQKVPLAAHRSSSVIQQPLR